MVEVIIWLMIAIGVIVIDLATSSFIFMWFSIGSLAAIVAYFLGFGIWGQIITFLLVGIITVAVGYPWAVKKFKAKENKLPTMEQKYIGRIMTSEEIIKEKSRIKVDGIYWTACNKGKTINPGEKFEITEIEGNKLIVKAKEA